MEIGEIEEALEKLKSCIPRIKWRISSSSRRRLLTDITVLCTGLRPVVMVDYGGKVPDLTENLCSLLKLCQEESSKLLFLRVMVIDDMVYLIHVQGFAKHASCDFQNQPLFVDLDQDPPRLLQFTEKNKLMSGLMEIQKLFSSIFPVGEISKDLSFNFPFPRSSGFKASTSSSLEEAISLQTNLVDLTACMKDSDVVIPTLNGWLLGYPVVYLFSKDHISDAIFNLSTKTLCIYKILACRKVASSKELHEEEILSFSIPYDLSIYRSQEPWALSFLDCLKKKLEMCTDVWSTLRLEVSECLCQAIAL